MVKVFEQVRDSNQKHRNLQCPRGVCFSRIHGEPKLSSRTGRGVATLVGIGEYIFQAQELGVFPYNVWHVLHLYTG